MTERLGSARVEELTNPAIRFDAAAALARELGAGSLLIFVSDVESGAVLPAPGFPQTMPDGRRWREFLAECMRSGRGSDSLPTPPSGAIQPVMAFARGGAVLALIGGHPRQFEAESVQEVLPLLGAALRNERSAQAALARAALASSTAEQARTMTAALDGTRRELQRALAEVQRVRSDLEGALALRDDFVSVASHELRNPIGALQLQIRALLIAVTTRREAASKEWIEERLQGAGRQVGRLVKLVDSLLDVSRMTAMRIGLDLDDTDLAAVTREAVERLQETVDVPIAVRVPDSLVGRWDQFRLDQVVTNLVSNALKYGQSKPVSVELERRGDMPGCESRTAGSVSRPKARNESSSGSSALFRAATSPDWAWVSGFPGRSSRHSAAGSQSRARPGGDRRSPSRCRSRALWRVWTGRPGIPRTADLRASVLSGGPGRLYSPERPRGAVARLP